MTNFERIKEYAVAGLWNKEQIKNAVIKGVITLDEMIEIFGECFNQNNDIDGAEIVTYARQAKIAEMSSECEKIITNGLDVELSDGETYHFSLTTQDQLNLVTLSGMISAGETNIPYHADGELCRLYSVEDATRIIEAATAFKTYNVTYFNSLKSYIAALTDVSVIANIEFGTTIPVEYQSDILQTLAQ